jgi:hypothetical protein
VTVLNQQRNNDDLIMASTDPISQRYFPDGIRQAKKTAAKAAVFHINQRIN